MAESRHHRGLPDLPRSPPGKRRPAATASRPSRRSENSSGATRRCRPPSVFRMCPSACLPAARQVLNSVFLAECVEAGLDSAIVHASKILPMARIDDEQREAALDLIYDRREYDARTVRSSYDPLQHFLAVFDGVSAQVSGADRAAELAAMPLFERLERRIVDGERKGLDDDLDEALRERPAMKIINETLLAGMRTVGELFGSGQMQLPFVLQSAEVMKAAVAHLEPHMEKTDEDGKGTIVLGHGQGRCP